MGRGGSGRGYGVPMAGDSGLREYRPVVASDRDEDARHRAASWLLSMAAGSTDALCLLYLGGVFASVITGNLVVFAASVVRGQTIATVGAAAEVVAYGLSVFAGSRLVARMRSPGHRERTPPRPTVVTTCLVIETILLLGLCAGWLASGGRPHGGAQPGLLVLAGAAMGMQTIAVRALGRPGLSTTYLTGAATRLVAGIGERDWLRRFDRVQAVALLGLVIGAAVESVLLRYLPLIGVLPAALLAAGTAVWARRRR